MSVKQVTLPPPVFSDAVDGKLKRKEIHNNSVNIRIPKYEGMAVGDWVTVPADVEPRPPLDYPITPPQMFEVTKVDDLNVSIRPPWESRYWTKVEVFYSVKGSHSQRVEVDVG